MRSSEVCPYPPLPDYLRRQEWLSTRVVAFLVSGLFWLLVAGFLFRLPYSSIRLEGQGVYLSQARSRGSGAALSIGVSVSQYIDDRHVGQLFTAPLRMTRGPSFQRALEAAYIMLAEAGYFIGLDKSQSTPSTCVCFLGFVCDSVRQAFVIPQEKRNKFATLREDILLSPFVSLKTLQRFSGKVISFSLAMPGSKLYVREVFKAISRHSGSSRPTIKLDANLRAEIE